MDILSELEELVLLSILRIGEQAYGLPIAQVIEGAIGKRLSTGSLFLTLHKLEQKGMISSSMGEPQNTRGGKARKFFKVEITGHQALAEAEKIRRNLKAGVKLVAIEGIN